MKVAIISDIHAHGIRTGKGNSSLIIYDSITKKPISQNPLESLLLLIKEQNIIADLLLLPGDFCDHSDGKAFDYVWTELKRVASGLKVSDMIGTVGNHDVVRGVADPFEIVKRTFSKEFPTLINQAQNQMFWLKGYCLVTISALDCDILIINSAFHHFDLNEVKNGKIDEDQLIELENMIKKNVKSKFKIALFHHHPIAHERMGNTTLDLMVNGSELLEKIDKYNFTIAIHGHKHDPRLKYSNGGPGATAVFASGSFSCVPELMLPGAYNTFHIITLEEDALPDCEKQGIIETWNFVPSKGWVTSNTLFLPSKCGFGCTLTPNKLAEKTFEILKRETLDSTKAQYNPMRWKDFIKHLPQVSYLTQSNFEKFGLLCKENYKIEFTTELPQSPEMIYLNV